MNKNISFSEDAKTGEVTVKIKVREYREWAKNAELPTWGGVGSKYPNHPKSYNVNLDGLPACISIRSMSITTDDAPTMTYAEAKALFMDDKISEAEFKQVKALYIKSL